jgi:thioredoxin 1
MSNTVQATTDSQFDQDVLQSDVPALVDFWAEWCGPCKMIAPVLKEAAADYHGRVNIYKVNVDENPNTSAQHSIRSIPSLLLFKGGSVVATHVGALTKSQLASFLDKHL